MLCSVDGFFVVWALLPGKKDMQGQDSSIQVSETAQCEEHNSQHSAAGLDLATVYKILIRAYVRTHCKHIYLDQEVIPLRKESISNE